MAIRTESFRFATLSCAVLALVATFNSMMTLAPVRHDLSDTTNAVDSQQSVPTADQQQSKVLEHVRPEAKKQTDTLRPPAPNPNSLEFVHIPKTGGTAIEYAASLANITWGLCHWKARDLAGPGCQYPDWAGYDALQNLSDHEIHWEYWHIPLRHLNVLESPYKNKKLFAVVRNPYERFISEFYCPYTGWNPVDWTQKDLGFEDPMGKPLEAALEHAQGQNGGAQQEKQGKKPETPSALNYFLMQRLQWFVKWTAHYLPQSDFVYDKDGVQIVEHVLRYERLQADFAELMKNYGLPVQLNSSVNKRKDDGKQVRLTVKDLYPATIQRINEVALQDFRKFGYPMIDPQALAAKRTPEQTVHRIYYINLLKNTQRRELMESWLSTQPIPFERINATIGSSDPNKCAAGKQQQDRCRGMSGLAKTELDIIRNHNTSGLTLVFEDDFIVNKPLNEIVDRTLRMVPLDWDIIRWDCWGEPLDSFDILVPNKVFRTYQNSTRKGGSGWFCGGTHAMLWREESVFKLERLWSQEPFDAIDCRLTTESLKSYCVNIGVGSLQTVDVESSDIPKS